MQGQLCLVAQAKLIESWSADVFLKAPWILVSTAYIQAKESYDSQNLSPAEPQLTLQELSVLVLFPRNQATVFVLLIERKESK